MKTNPYIYIYIYIYIQAYLGLCYRGCFRNISQPILVQTISNIRNVVKRSKTERKNTLYKWMRKFFNNIS